MHGYQNHKQYAWFILENMLYSIYKITNKVNDTVYIGQTKQKPRLRYLKHISDARLGKSNTYISRALSKHGPENFTFEVIACCKTQEDCNYLENYFISKYNSIVPNGYNVSSGGHRGFVLTSEQKAIRSVNSKKYAKKTPVTIIDCVTRVGMSFESKYELARYFNCSPVRIYEALKRKSKIHKGYYILLSEDYNSFTYLPNVKAHSKPLLAFDEDGNEYAFARLCDVVKIGASRSVVTRCLKNIKYTSNGFHFKQITVHEYINHKNKILPQ
jgi:hypothetical protein